MPDRTALNLADLSFGILQVVRRLAKSIAAINLALVLCFLTLSDLLRLEGLNCLQRLMPPPGHSMHAMCTIIAIPTLVSEP